MEKLNRRYRDNRGIEVHVIGYEREKRQVIFTRAGYAPECMQPVERFREKFTRIAEDHEPATDKAADSDKS